MAAAKGNLGPWPERRILLPAHAHVGDLPEPRDADEVCVQVLHYFFLPINI
jgi:hypothetical protein